MSSHHIIREDQEPALLVLDAVSISHDSFQQLLEWSPTIIACEGSIEYLLSWGLKIDVALISKTSSFKEQLQNQLPIQFLFTESDNFLDEGLEFVSKKKYRTINCFVSDKKSLDYMSQKKLSIEIVAFCSGIRWSLIRIGSFSKWFPQGAHIFIHPQLEMHTEGLSDQLMVINSGFVKLRQTNNFWVGEEI